MSGKTGVQGPIGCKDVPAKMNLSIENKLETMYNNFINKKGGKAHG